jgi:hypothetical protein
MVGSMCSQYNVKFGPGFDMGWTFCGSMYLVIPCLFPSSPMLVLSPTMLGTKPQMRGKAGTTPSHINIRKIQRQEVLARMLWGLLLHESHASNNNLCALVASSSLMSQTDYDNSSSYYDAVICFPVAKFCNLANISQ